MMGEERKKGERENLKCEDGNNEILINDDDDGIFI